MGDGHVEPARVVVYIDYENTYRGAKESFHSWTDGYVAGHFHPGKLGELIVDRSKFPRELVQVRVYRGQADPDKQPGSHAAAERQFAKWQEDPKVRIKRRPLNYRGWPAEKPREKGIDVQLAIDFIEGALKGYYDVGVLVSRDTDLKPALEFVIAGTRPGEIFPRCEVAAWESQERHSQRLAIPGQTVWCHWLDRNAYGLVCDTTDYTVEA